MQEHENTPFTIEIFNTYLKGEVVGKRLRLKCSTCGKEQIKDVKSLNPRDFQDAVKKLFEESRLHASSHVDTSSNE